MEENKTYSINNRKSMYNIPILFIFFNRTKIAIESFQCIKKNRPLRLYLASDGPRNDKEAEIVNNTRQVILDSIDWDCEVKTLFREKNLGCGSGVYDAINWLFENENQGIILEDDCIVNDSFFRFMSEMLTEYKYDERIGMIAGTNPIIIKNYKYSYLFSNFKSCWGWATWKRSWDNMDINMNWRDTEFDSIIANCGYRCSSRREWLFKLKAIDNNYVSAWDWQWYFSLAAQNQLCIYPKVNLVTNIGNDLNATHTSFSSISMPSFPMDFPLKRPHYVVPCISFEKKFASASNTLYSRLSRIIPNGIKRNIKTVIKKYYRHAKN